MSSSAILNLAHIRQSCSHCSLQSLCLLASVDPNDREHLDRLVRRRRSMARSERLFRIGMPLEALYVAREGVFKTVSINDDGQEQIVGFHLPGEVIGLDALGSGRHRCEAEALSPALVCELPLEALHESGCRLPGLQSQVLRVIGRSVDRDQDHMAMLGKRQAQERIAMFLHSLSERYRLLGQPGHEFSLPMSREDIAHYLGLVIETVSRCFSRLQEEGIIKVRGRQLRILRPDALIAISHGGAPMTSRRKTESGVARP